MKHKKGDIVQTTLDVDVLVIEGEVIRGEELYRVRCLNWTPEHIQDMGGLSEAWIIMSGNQLVHLKERRL
jgi:hypothetical protein